MKRRSRSIENDAQKRESKQARYLTKSGMSEGNEYTEIKMSYQSQVPRAAGGGIGGAARDVVAA